MQRQGVQGDGVPAARGYAGGFSTRLMMKDLQLALDAAGKDAATGAASARVGAVSNQGAASVGSSAGNVANGSSDTASATGVASGGIAADGLPLAHRALELYAASAAAGGADLDFASIYKLIYCREAA